MQTERVSTNGTSALLKQKKKLANAVVEEEVKIPKLNLQYATMTIEGISPLLVNRFTEKSRKQIADKRSKSASAMQRTARDPEAEFLASLYPVPGKKNKWGIPAGGVKKCVVTATTFVDGFFKTTARGAFQIIAGPGNMIEIDGDKPVLDEQYVRIGPKKLPDVRYRARFDNWSLTFKIAYNADVISASQIANLYEVAGFSVGLCEFRPEKDGTFGMFRVKRS